MITTSFKLFFYLFIILLYFSVVSMWFQRTQQTSKRFTNFSGKTNTTGVSIPCTVRFPFIFKNAANSLLHLDFVYRRKSWKCFVQHNKYHHRKVLLSSFYLNGQTDSKVRTTLYSIINRTTGKYCSIAFI